MSEKSKNTSWVVRLECVVTKEVICDDCTEEEAKENPFMHASDERETGMQDWTVMGIEENK